MADAAACGFPQGDAAPGLVEFWRLKALPKSALTFLRRNATLGGGLVTTTFIHSERSAILIDLEVIHYHR